MKEDNEAATEADVVRFIRSLTASGSLDAENLKTLIIALEYFDSFVEKIKDKYQKDIQENRLTQNQVYGKCFDFLADHGYGVSNYRKNFTVRAVEVIMDLPRDYALIMIGGFLTRAAELEAHSQFYKKSDPKLRLKGVILERIDLPQYQNNREKLITDIVSVLNEKYNTVKSAVQRIRKNKIPKKVQLP